MKAQSEGQSQIRLASAIASGVITIAVAVAALFLPLVQSIPKAGFLGLLLSVAGFVEVALGLVLRGEEFGKAAIASGLVTVTVGLTFAIAPNAGFYPVAPAMGVWLGLSGACMLLGALALKGRGTGSWLVATGGIDILLGILLYKGLRITSLAYILFGPSPQMVATLALVVALSLTVRGVCQIAIGVIERRPAAKGACARAGQDSGGGGAR